jgi:hypothetical protein
MRVGRGHAYKARDYNAQALICEACLVRLSQTSMGHDKTAVFFSCYIDTESLHSIGVICPRQIKMTQRRPKQVSQAVLRCLQPTSIVQSNDRPANSGD